MGRRILGVTIVAAALVSACTLERTPAPSLQGPSELALALSITANPDVLSQDGASQSQIVVQTRDADGQPVASVPFRAEISVAGVAADYGSLSGRTFVTGSDGRAAFTYTAPPAPLVSVDTGTIVDILVTPSGTNYGNAESRYVRIRLVPPGVLIPPGDEPEPPVADFSFTPSSPTVLSNVVFISTSTGTFGTYSWNFGDGSTGAGSTVTHQYSTADTYPVTLTVTDIYGETNSKTQTVTVSAGALPSADFVYSPSAPVINQDVFFNAGASKAGTGRSLVRYDWNFGSGTPLMGITVSKKYDVAGTYAVTLTVTDDAGQTAVKTTSLTISATAGLTADFSVSPTNPTTITPVYFNAGSSSTSAGATITRYDWDFGDGSLLPNQTSPVPTPPGHTYSQALTYTVRLTVYDTLLRTATVTKTVTVTAPAP